MDSPDLDDQLEADVYTNLPSSHNDSSTGITTRRNRSSFKSKHSETEQRRRSKINERFQNLMDIIPQNDQKRDKASFLLEVIEYIHFLQDKVVMYEGSHQMWHQAPTKLIPWRNNQGSVDHTQILQSFLSNDEVAAPNADSLASTNILEHCPLSAVSSYTPTQPVPQFLLPEFWQPRPSSESVNKHEMSNSGENPPAIMSAVCSQRVSHTLTEALKSSGVDMSETMLSVKLSVRKRSDREYSITGLASKDNSNSIADEEADFPTVAKSLCKDLDNSESLKKTRR